MNSLQFIKQHVTEWPDVKYGGMRHVVLLNDDGVVNFYYRKPARQTMTIDLSEHFAPDYYDGKVWTREEFEAFGIDATVSHNKYEREISDRQGNSVTVDVYDVLKAFDVVCPATQHALKKLLCTGIRGHKDTATDLIEARESITRAIELRG